MGIEGVSSIDYNEGVSKEFSPAVDWNGRTIKLLERDGDWGFDNQTLKSQLMKSADYSIYICRHPSQLTTTQSVDGSSRGE